MQSQTIKSYVSAIRNVLLDDGWELSENKFLLSSLTKACRFKNNTVRTRLPIQTNLLHELLKFTKKFYLQQNQPYLAILYESLFLTTYFGLLRVSEVTVTKSFHTIRVSDVHLGVNKNKVLFTLQSSKTHGRYNKPQLVKITTKEFHHGVPNKAHKICPFRSLQNYLLIRPCYLNITEPFFVFRDRSPVTDLHMRSTLHLTLKLMGYQEHLYNCHSFRVGRSCDLMRFGVSVETIKKLGRWKSNVVFSYLRQYF